MMKSLNNSREVSVRFLFHNLEQSESISSEEKKQQDLTPERQAQLDKNSKERGNQAIINQALEALEGIDSEVLSYMEDADGGVDSGKEFPDGFERVPASAFLAMSPEQLQKLFVNNGEVDFRGNAGCRKYIGMGDLFSQSQEFIQVEIDGNVRIGKRSVRAANGKIGYLDQSGKYIPIVGGERITVIDAAQAEASAGESFSQFASIQTLSPEEETVAQDNFRESLSAQEEQDERLHEACKNGLDGLSLDGIENPRQIFYLKAKAVAMELESETGFPWQITVAQAVFESGHGESGLSSDGNNHFGIKGRGYRSDTTEYSGGKAGRVSGEFQSYSGFEDSFLHHNDLFFGKERYTNVIESAVAGTKFQVDSKFVHPDTPDKGVGARKIETAEDMLWGVIDSGYATLPTGEYISRTQNILSQYDSSPGASLNVRITDQQREKMAKYLGRIS